jgi:hypothetical protein
LLVGGVGRLELTGFTVKHVFSPLNPVDVFFAEQPFRPHEEKK